MAMFDKDGNLDPAAMAASAEESRVEMESLALKIRDATLSLPPVKLLAYALVGVHTKILADIREQDDDYRPDKDLVGEFGFAMEYLHAVWSSHSDLLPETAPFDEAKAAEVLTLLTQLKAVTFNYCLASSGAKHAAGGDDYLTTLEFQAKSTWVNIRGHRYQVLEGEFFQYVLAPHADALREAYGMEPEAIAAGIQGVADKLRAGMRDAAIKLHEGMEKVDALMEGDATDMAGAIAALGEADANFAAEIGIAWDDLLNGGICNLSRHSGFTQPLLEDLSFVPGGNTEFFANGNFKGTPLRTLPARVRPGIKLGESFYSTDGSFIRDSAYRTIQRGLLARLPAYRDNWRIRQQDLVERAFPTICSQQLGQATEYQSVFYPDPITGEMCECDLVLIQDDVMLVVEGKAGAMPMHSPETSFDRFKRLIDELILKAYAQCKRFVDHLASAPEVEIFKLVDGKYVPAAKLRLKDYRVIVPIGLTVEAFTPFSAMVKAHPETQPLLGTHPFVSMSVDDLFVLNRFLPTTGELLHYLQVRQQAARLPNATIFDEIDHLGAYISRNRFDMDIEENLKTADMMWMDAFCDVVDRHFEGENWQTEPTPHQTYPAAYGAVLAALDQKRPAGWLAMDTILRDRGGQARDGIADLMTQLAASLVDHKARRFLLVDVPPIEIVVCRKGSEPTVQEARRSGQMSCLVVEAPRVSILVVSYFPSGKIAEVGCHFVEAPALDQADYDQLQAEAARRRASARPAR